MPVLEILFPAGRYHATAWGRNVNEGEPEWPPSPFRLARALVDMRFRRHADIGDEQLQNALLLLGGSPRFSLPPFGKSTVKYYQDQGKNPLERQPVLDAFVCVCKEDALYMDLPMARSEAFLTLEKLLLSLPYLGRSESWISARVCDSLPDRRTWNCVPVAHSVQLEEMIHVQTLLEPRQYDLLPYLPSTGAGRKKRPCTWLEALTLSTSTLLKNGWNRHPLLGQCTYAMTVEERRTGGSHEPPQTVLRQRSSARFAAFQRQGRGRQASDWASARLLLALRHGQGRKDRPRAHLFAPDSDTG